MKGNKGLTFVELILAMTILAIVTPIITTILSRTLGSFSAYEMTSELRKANQGIMHAIHSRLGSSRRLFQRGLDDEYLNRVSLAGAPARLAGSLLPQIRETGSIVLGNADFNAASAGNSLFFANTERTEVLENILDTDNDPHTIRVEFYRFHYYYLSPDNPTPVANMPSYTMIEIRSRMYADYNQLQTIEDVVLRQNARLALFDAGFNLEWDSTETDIARAFYLINNDGTNGVDDSHIITAAEVRTHLHILTGVMGVGYRYGIAPNSSLSDELQVDVPIYATGSGEFPGGFEVMVVGAAGGRQLMIRVVLVARGGMRREVVHDQLQHVVSVRDLW